MPTGRAQFIKAALMTHTSAAYVLILSALGFLEQTRDLFISEATQERWHVDKIRLPFWFWMLLILGVVIWRLVDYSHREISARDKRIEEHEHEFSGKWEQLASQFDKIPRTVTVQWQHGGLTFTGEKIQDLWTIRGEGYLDIMPLCKKAGTMLLLSPKVLMRLSDKVKSEPNPVDRWLHFLKENHGALKIDSHPAVFRDHDGNEQIILMGDINELGAASARACADCSAEEL